MLALPRMMPNGIRTYISNPETSSITLSAAPRRSALPCAAVHSPFTGLMPVDAPARPSPISTLDLALAHGNSTLTSKGSAFPGLHRASRAAGPATGSSPTAIPSAPGRPPRCRAVSGMPLDQPGTPFWEHVLAGAEARLRISFSISSTRERGRSSTNSCRSAQDGPSLWRSSTPTSVGLLAGRGPSQACLVVSLHGPTPVLCDVNPKPECWRRLEAFVMTSASADPPKWHDYQTFSSTRIGYASTTHIAITALIASILFVPKPALRRADLRCP
jgi:hypothetical protein